MTLYVFFFYVELLFVKQNLSGHVLSCNNFRRLSLRAKSISMAKHPLFVSLGDNVCKDSGCTLQIPTKLIQNKELVNYEN